MTSCWACDTELSPEWKFCIHCGVPREDDAAAVARTPISPIAVFGLLLAGIALVLVIVGLVVMFTAT